MSRGILLPAYIVGDAITFLYLMVSDFSLLNAWNWIIIVPVNCFLAAIWPIYWSVLHWVFR